jgi:hypothetical protein
MNILLYEKSIEIFQRDVTNRKHKNRDSQNAYKQLVNTLSGEDQKT